MLVFSRSCVCVCVSGLCFRENARDGGERPHDGRAIHLRVEAVRRRGPNPHLRRRQLCRHGAHGRHRRQGRPQDDGLQAL